MVNYQNGKIYKLTSANDPEFYVGSTTTSLKERFSVHRSVSEAKPNQRVYQHFNQVGWANVKIELIEPWECLSKQELLDRELHWIKTLKPTLNTVIPIKTDDQKGDDPDLEEYLNSMKQQRQRKYKSPEEAKAAQLNQIRAWIDKHRDSVRAYNLKKYYENKEKILAQKREDYRQNREQILAKQKAKRAEQAANKYPYLNFEPVDNLEEIMPGSIPEYQVE